MKSLLLAPVLMCASAVCAQEGVQDWEKTWATMFMVVDYMDSRGDVQGAQRLLKGMGFDDSTSERLLYCSF